MLSPIFRSLLRYKKSPAQILIKWSLQKGYICIPKSSKKERIIENTDIFDFTISENDMTAMVGFLFIVKKITISFVLVPLLLLEWLGLPFGH